MGPNKMAMRKALATAPAYYRADDESIAFYVRYIGSSASCKISVASATGDLSSSVGAAGAEAADANFTSGSTTGSIDVSAAAADTIGEVVAIINALDDYECVMFEALAADSADDTLAYMAATQCKTAAGIPIYWDSSACKHITIALTNARDIFSSYAAGELPADEDDGYTFAWRWIESLNTYASGTNKIQVYSGASKLLEVSGGATATAQLLGAYEVVDGGNEGYSGEPLLVRMVGSIYCTGHLSIGGYKIRK